LTGDLGTKSNPVPDHLRSKAAASGNHDRLWRRPPSENLMMTSISGVPLFALGKFKLRDDIKHDYKISAGFAHEHLAGQLHRLAALGACHFVARTPKSR
jgi:hypothetical protein